MGVAMASETKGNAAKHVRSTKFDGRLIAQVMRLVAAGKTVADVVRLFGVSPTRIRGWIKRPSPKTGPKFAAPGVKRTSRHTDLEDRVVALASDAIATMFVAAVQRRSETPWQTEGRAKS